jgi:hypothetical protein
LVPAGVPRQQAADRLDDRRDRLVRREAVGPAWGLDRILDGVEVLVRRQTG